ncbi:hypothetical protein YP516_1345 [Yersinia pestis Nepal516]|nr:hypothetical protein YP516_1345 [Yersinia pestis Nepal516]
MDHFSSVVDNLGRGSYVDGHQLIFRRGEQKKNPPGWV